MRSFVRTWQTCQFNGLYMWHPSSAPVCFHQNPIHELLKCLRLATWQPAQARFHLDEEQLNAGDCLIGACTEWIMASLTLLGIRSWLELNQSTTNWKRVLSRRCEFSEIQSNWEISMNICKDHSHSHHNICIHRACDHNHFTDSRF